MFEGLALNALVQNECDPEFQRLLLYSALEEHELAQMFWDKFVRRVYEFLGDYIRERQKDGAMVEIEPAIVVRAFIGMVIHHSLNNNLYDRKRSLLKISNEEAAGRFARILLDGITAASSSTTKGKRVIDFAGRNTGRNEQTKKRISLSRDKKKVKR